MIEIKKLIAIAALRFKEPHYKHLLTKLDTGNLQKYKTEVDGAQNFSYIKLVQLDIFGSLMVPIGPLRFDGGQQWQLPSCNLNYYGVDYQLVKEFC